MTIILQKQGKRIELHRSIISMYYQNQAIVNMKLILINQDTLEQSLKRRQNKTKIKTKKNNEKIIKESKILHQKILIKCKRKLQKRNRGTEKRHIENKGKMADVNLTISIINLNMNRLNHPIKRQRSSERLKT